LDNSFDKVNQVQCFNHTIQLSAKSLLKPFNTALSKTPTDDGMAVEDDNNQVLNQDNEEDEGDEDEDKEDEDEGDNEAEEEFDDNVEDDNIDKVQELSEDKQMQVLEETAAVHGTVTKVHIGFRTGILRVPFSNTVPVPAYTVPVSGRVEPLPAIRAVSNGYLPFFLFY
jgi:hypothetical protein